MSVVGNGRSVWGHTCKAWPSICASRRIAIHIHRQGASPFPTCSFEVPRRLALLGMTIALLDFQAAHESAAIPSPRRRCLRPDPGSSSPLGVSRKRRSDLGPRASDTQDRYTAVDPKHFYPTRHTTASKSRITRSVTMPFSLQRIRKRAAALVWLLSTVLVSFPLGVHAADIVLCIETDGQVAIEDFVGNSCGSSVTLGLLEHQSHELTVKPQGEASHCGSCIDIPIRTSSDKDCSSFRVEPAKYADFQLYRVVWLDVTPTSEGVPVVRLTDAPTTGDGWQLTSLETVILLT